MDSSAPSPDPARLSDAWACGRLVRYALQPKLRPSQCAEYEELVTRLQQDTLLLTSFRELVEGMGLILLTADEYGVVLGCEQEGPFAMVLADFRGGMKQIDRLVYGLLQLAIAAWCFPRAEELEQRTAAVQRIPVSPLTDWLVELCERLAKGETKDAALERPELQQAWREVLRRAPRRKTSAGRRTASSLEGMLVHCLEALEGQGLARKESSEQGGTWRSTRAYRVQVRELAASAAFRAVRAASEGSC